MYLLTPEEISMSDWKDLFQEHILARGEAYYFDGAVLEGKQLRRSIIVCDTITDLRAGLVSKS